ncbi:MAG: HAMP domain-containing histidine kinase [Oscillospiraceae bacterium]|nr:HAMP domain-containing histidine kinase [Oscillospiraceae bacterium]
MKNSTYFRIFIATALIVFISITVLGGLSVTLNYRRTMSEKRTMMTSTLQETARYITTQQLHYGTPLDDLELNMWLAVTSRITGFDLLITNADGIVVSYSAHAFGKLGERVPEHILRTIDIGDGSVMMSTLGQIYSARRQVAGVPLAMSMSGELRTYGYLFLSSDVASLRQEWRNFSTAFILLSLSVMVLAFIISFIALKKQSEPLNEMADAARRFARGEFDVRVKSTGRLDEIGQLTEAFNAMADSLESSEQLRRDFIANLSHELKTPMTVIAGFAEGLLDGTIKRENEARYLNVISSETRRLSRLVRSMLELSTLDETDAALMLESSFDISEVARLSLLSFEGEIEAKQLVVEAELPDDAVLTRGDKDSITQVVHNLIDNAIKFSNHNGVIGLELWQHGEKVFVSVTNHGETIPEQELPNIFERFHKTDKSRGIDRDGVGLGLYIVKAILDSHNEDIFVTSNAGVTKFIFSLTVV